MYKVLLVDDEIEILNDHSKYIERLGYKCYTAQNGKDAFHLLKEKRPDIVLTDIRMPHEGGLSVLKETQKFDPDIPVILFTGFATVESAVQAMKLGAYDYIKKPFSPKLMEVVLKRATNYCRLKNENIALKTQIKETYQLQNIIGKSQAMLDIAKRVHKVARTNANVFIDGESGTGKELVARSIHLHSPRKNKPFIPVDCVALPTTLMESELFGFEKGAFTGATMAKPGLLELAHNGTLFLDEVTELDLPLQAKLLRVLQERQFRRIGSTKVINVDFRIISATNRNPENAVKEKILRQDLFYRLNVVPVLLPPLRNRREDIPLLVHHFIQKFKSSCPHEITGITKDAMKILKKHEWPGNVRELQNVIEHAMSLTEQVKIGMEDLPENIRETTASFLEGSLLSLNFKEARQKCLHQFNTYYIENLLKKYDGNISEISRKAGISRWSIYRILKNPNTDQE